MRGTDPLTRTQFRSVIFGQQLDDATGRLCASETMARVMTPAEGRSAVSTVVTLMICLAVCALMMLAFHFEAACSAATATRLGQEGSCHQWQRSR